VGSCLGTRERSRTGRRPYRGMSYRATPSERRRGRVLHAHALRPRHRRSPASKRVDMKPRFAARLVCPEDRGPLQLIAWETRSASYSSSDQELLERAGVPHESEEVVTGVLHNPRLRRVYPIVHGVPRMLLFATGVSRAFQKEYGAR